MKNIYKLVYGFLCITVAGLLFSCSDDDKYRVAPEIEGTFSLTLTSPQANAEVILDKEKANETAVTFAWKMANDKGADATTFHYDFDMDIAGNNFETAIDVVNLESNLSKSFTHKELSDLIVSHWGKTTGSVVELEARLKATNTVTGAKTRTVWATVKFKISDFETEVFEIVVEKPEEDALVSLSIMKDLETAIDFSWKAVNNKDEEVSVFSYSFTMDIAGNEFAAAIPVEDLGQVAQKSYTHRQLSDLIGMHWGKNLGDLVELEAKIIATNNELIENPIETVIRFNVQNNYLLPENLYLTGEATSAGNNLSNVLVLDKSEDGKGFYWRGTLSTNGGFKFLYSNESMLPSLNKGEGEASLSPRRENTEADALFSVTKNGNYAIAINLVEMSIAYKFVPLENLYLLGNATPAGWNIDDADEVVWQRQSPNIFIYEGQLNTGELKMPSERGNWLCDFLMAYDPADPDKTLVPITGDWQDATIVNGADAMNNNNLDKKWEITSAGAYKVTVDMNNMKVKFEKK